MAVITGPRDWVEAQRLGLTTDLLADSSPWVILDVDEDELLDTATVA